MLTVLMEMKNSHSLSFGGEMSRNANTVQHANGFHGFVGTVDGCHIPIERPREDEHTYVNRKASTRVS